MYDARRLRLSDLGQVEARINNVLRDVGELQSLLGLNNVVGADRYANASSAQGDDPGGSLPSAGLAWTNSTPL